MEDCPRRPYQPRKMPGCRVVSLFRYEQIATGRWNEKQKGWEQSKLHRTHLKVVWNKNFSWNVVDAQANAGRADWAKSTCRIITDGVEFAECRKKVADYQIFYKDCLYDTCGSVWHFERRHISVQYPHSFFAIFSPQARTGPPGCLALARWAGWFAGQVVRHVKC